MTSESGLPKRSELHSGKQGSPATQFPQQPREPKKKRSVGKTALWAILGLLALILIPVGILAGFLWNVSSTFNHESETIAEVFPDEQSRPAQREDEAQTILLLGSDTRGEINADGLEESQDGRSDTIMVVRIPADRSAIYITSIMRDSWVDIPGYGMNKINAAFAFGGIPLTVATVEQLLDTRIDHVAVIDFDGFRGLTNALGGVTVNNQIAFDTFGLGPNKEINTYHFNEGKITLMGDEALAYVRARKPFPDGDYQRVRNQQAYMKGLISQILSRDTLTSPGTISNVVSEIAPFLAVDEGLTGGYIIGLGPELRSIRSGDIYFLTLPTEGVGWSPDGKQSIIVLDEAGMEQVRQAFHDDTVGELVDNG